MEVNKWWSFFIINVIWRQKLFYHIACENKQNTLNSEYEELNLEELDYACLDLLKSRESSRFWWHNLSWRYLWLGLFYNLCFRNSFGRCGYWWFRFGYYFLSRSCNNICGVLRVYNSLASMTLFQELHGTVCFSVPLQRSEPRKSEVPIA